MKPRRLHLALLRSAARLVPRNQRAEWYAEWTAELWYVDAGRATSFCLGAFKDALWFRRHHPQTIRLQSPMQCLAFLAFLAAVGLTLSRPSEPPAHNLPTRGNLEGLVAIAPFGRRPVAPAANIRLADYQAWNNDRQQVFSALAFYQPAFESVVLPDHRRAILSIARTNQNLLQLLHVALPAGRGPTLILSLKGWCQFFAGDSRIFGQPLEIAGRTVSISGLMPEGAVKLPGGIDAWLFEDPRHFAALPPDSLGFVVGHVWKPSTYSMSVSDGSGGRDYFQCIPLTERVYPVAGGFLMTILMSAMILVVTTSLSLGRYPAKTGLRRWIFLAGKLGLILVIVYCALRFVAHRGSDPGILLLAILAFRWAIVDQRKRCPVCLRLVSHPVRVGQPSQTFLAWYGTEFICSKGHGLLHVPEIHTSCYSTQQWMRLDPTWQNLF